jgi:multidrug efflux system membrane fusion protein
MTSGTITAKAAFSNDDLALWPGQYVDVEIDADTLPNVTIVPDRRGPDRPEGALRLCRQAGQTVELRPVKVALTDGDRTAP